jgi:hypothetical protein
MTKNTKILLGVAAVAGLGYYFFMKPKATASFMNAEGGQGCPCKKIVGEDTTSDGRPLYECAGGHYCKTKRKAQQ